MHFAAKRETYGGGKALHIVGGSFTCQLEIERNEKCHVKESVTTKSKPPVISEQFMNPMGYLIP